MKIKSPINTLDLEELLQIDSFNINKKMKGWLKQMTNTITTKFMFGTKTIYINDLTVQEIEMIRELESVAINGKRYLFDEMEYHLDADGHYLVIFLY